MSLPGKLIVFEGIDGVGKSTLARKLAEHLNSVNISCKHFAFPGQEMGTLGHHVYVLHHDLEQFGIRTVSPTSLQILHIAAHIDAIEQTILPALTQGYYVILDRFWWSTWVYGRVNGVHLRSLEAMLKVEFIHWGSYLPEVVFLIGRSELLRNDIPAEKQLNLESYYQELANCEIEKYRVEWINNDTAIEETLKHIINVTNSFQNELVADD